MPFLSQSLFPTAFWDCRMHFWPILNRERFLEDLLTESHCCRFAVVFLLMAACLSTGLRAFFEVGKHVLKVQPKRSSEGDNFALTSGELFTSIMCKRTSLERTPLFFSMHPLIFARLRSARPLLWWKWGEDGRTVKSQDLAHSSNWALRKYVALSHLKISGWKHLSHLWTGQK